MRLLWGKERIEEKLLNLRFTISPNSFFQVSPRPSCPSSPRPRAPAAFGQRPWLRHVLEQGMHVERFDRSVARAGAGLGGGLAGGRGGSGSGMKNGRIAGGARLHLDGPHGPELAHDEFEVLPFFNPDQD